MNLSLLASNNAKSVLASGISSSATVLTVSTGSGSLFPAPTPGENYFKLTIVDVATKAINEIVHVTSVTGDVMTVLRGQEGTVGRVWSTNDIVANMMTAGTFSACLQTSNNLSEIKDAGADAVSSALSNLGFPKRSFSDTDFIRIPDVDGGLIIQFGAQAINSPSGHVTFPTPFPNAALVFIPVKNSDAAARFVSYSNLTGTGADVYGWIADGTTTANVDNFNWIAVGN